MTRAQGFHRGGTAWPPFGACLVAALLTLILPTTRVRAEGAEAGAAATPQAYRAVSALGRIEPQHGILRLSAPSVPDAISGALVAELLVDVGEAVSVEQLLAVTDTAAVLQAKVDESAAQLVVAEQQQAAAVSTADAACVRAGVFQREAERLVRLREQNLAAEDEIDRARGNAEAGAADCTAARGAAQVGAAQIALEQARLTRHRAELDRAFVRAPSAGVVLAVHARPGEQVGPAGILELGRVDRMYAIAEVYETDVGNLRVGQTASVRSPALPEPLVGKIERIRPLVRKMDEIGTDPAARKDARIVEVDVLLEAPDAVAALSNLQVEVIFQR
ncbi:MAG: efflux RND transporter periplasmic adaptor subunit [Pseudomonadales bacterium]